MKIKIGLLLLFLCNIVFAQRECEKDSIIFANAYNYIAKDFKAKVWFQDSIFDINNIMVFRQDLKSYPEIVENLMQDFNSDSVTDFLYQSLCLASIVHADYSLAKHVVFFSPIKDSVLMAEIYPLKRYNPFKHKKIKLKKNELVYKRVSRFTTGQFYLFIFDKDQEIKDVFTCKMILD